MTHNNLPRKIEPTEKDLDTICLDLEKMQRGLERFYDNLDVREYISTIYNSHTTVLKDRNNTNEFRHYNNWIRIYDNIYPIDKIKHHNP